MKKIILTASFAIAMLFVGIQDSYAKFVFVPLNLGGMPGTFGGCFGSGFCRDDNPTDIMTQAINNGDGTVTLIINTTSFNPENQDFYQNRNTFELQTPFPLLPNECAELELDPNASLQPGAYPILKEGDLFRITIPVAQ